MNCGASGGDSKPRYLVQSFHPHPEVRVLQVLYGSLVISSIEYRRQDLGDLSGWDIASCEMVDELVSRVAGGSHGGGECGARSPQACGVARNLIAAGLRISV